MAFHMQWPQIVFIDDNDYTEKGANVNAVDSSGQTALHDAVRRADLPIIEELLKNEASTNIKPFKGPFESVSAAEMVEEDPEMKSLFSTYESTESTTDTYDEKLPVALQNGVCQKETPSFVSPCYQDEIDILVRFLCPTPQHVRQFKGLFFVLPSAMNISLVGCKDSAFVACEMIGMFSDKFKSLGCDIAVEYKSKGDVERNRTSCIECTINKMRFAHKDEYYIQINTNKIVVVASNMKSLYWAFCTLLQCIKLYRGKSIPLLQLCDWPNHQYRSVSLAFHENDMPNLAVFCSAIDLLSTFKVNRVEINLNQLRNVEGVAYLSNSELNELQTFSRKRFVAIYPYLKADTFPSLIRNVNNNDNDSELDEAELEDVLQHFMDIKHLHVDLRGKNDAKLVKHLSNFCMTCDIFYQLSSDVIETRLDHIATLVSACCSTIYTNEMNDEKVEQMKELGLPFIVCCESDKMTRIFPDILALLTDFSKTLSRFQNDNCLGYTVKLSHAQRNVSNFSTSLPSLLILTAAAWNSPAKADESYISSVIDNLVYEDDSDNLGRIYLAFGSALPCVFQNGPAVKLLNDFSDERILECLNLDSDSLQILCRSVKELKRCVLSLKTDSLLSTMHKEESNILSDLIFFLCKIFFSLMNTKTQTTESPLLSDLPDTMLSDAANRLIVFISQYKTCSAKYYNTPPSGSTSVSLLNELLETIIIPHTHKLRKPNVIQI